MSTQTGRERAESIHRPILHDAIPFVEGWIEMNFGVWPDIDVGGEVAPIRGSIVYTFEINEATAHLINRHGVWDIYVKRGDCYCEKKAIYDLEDAAAGVAEAAERLKRTQSMGDD